MLEEWLKSGQPKLVDMMEALRSPCVDRSDVARKLEAAAESCQHLFNHLH